MYVYNRLVTTNDRSGTPRRVCVVYFIDPSAHPQLARERVAVLNEGYDGEYIVKKHYEGAVKLGEYQIAPAEFKVYKKLSEQPDMQGGTKVVTLQAAR